MTENQWWSSHVKPRWHVPPKQWIALKNQDITNRGMPDTTCCFAGVVARVELKYKDVFPKKDDQVLTFSKDKTTGKACMLSTEQYRQLHQWDAAGGYAYVLIGLHKAWYLLHIQDIVNTGMSLDDLDQWCLLNGDRAELSDVPRRLASLGLFNPGMSRREQYILFTTGQPNV